MQILTNLKGRKILNLALLILIVTSFNSFSQSSAEVEVQMGAKLDYPKRSTLLDIVGSDNDGIYVIRRSLLQYKINLVKYNHDLTESKSVNFERKINDQNRSFEGIYQFNNNFHMLTSFADRETKVNTLFLQTIDKKTLELGSKNKVLAEINFAEERKKNSGGFTISTSRDSSKFLVHYNLPYNKGENEKFGMKVFNRDFDLLWEKEVTIPYLDELFGIQEFEISNSGNVYVLGTIVKEKDGLGRVKAEKKGKPNYTYHILSYSKDQDDVNEYPISNEDNFLSDMTISVDKSDNLICAGFYSKKGTYSIAGSYFIKINGLSKAVLVDSFKEFDLAFITQNMSAKDRKKTEKKAEKDKDPELYRYQLDGIVMRSDGGAMLIGEQAYVTSYTNSKGSTYYQYRFNDIIVVNIDPLGNIEWNAKIAKKQFSVNDSGMFGSYVTTVVGDKLHLVFNDNALNIGLPENQEAETFAQQKKSVTVVVTLDSEANQKRKVLYVNGDAEILTRSSVSEQISKNELLLYGQRKKAHRLIKIHFN